MSEKTYITTYKPLPIAFSHGEGLWLWEEGVSAMPFLDAYAGIAVCSLGHAHPRIVAAIQDQASKLMHTANGVQIPWQTQLAEKLLGMSGMSQIFMTNSGLEANETALKIARLFGHKQDFQRPKIIVTDGAFHGRSLALISASGRRLYQAGFEPLVDGFVRVPYNDLNAIQQVAENQDEITAVMVEPIQGENGIIIPSEDYLTGIRAICDEHGWLMILDEIQTGIARTGALYAFQHHGIVPDICTSAKGLGNGFPVGACLMHHKAVDLLQPGQHGSTFGGNPLACRTAFEVLSVIEDDNLIKHVQHISQYFMNTLREKLTQPCVKAIRGQGLMIGVELHESPMPAMRGIMLNQKIILNITADKVIRLVPALIITEKEVDILVERLSACLDDWMAAGS